MAVMYALLIVLVLLLIAYVGGIPLDFRALALGASLVLVTVGVTMFFTLRQMRGRLGGEEEREKEREAEEGGSDLSRSYADWVFARTLLNKIATIEPNVRLRTLLEGWLIQNPTHRQQLAGMSRLRNTLKEAGGFTELDEIEDMTRQLIEAAMEEPEDPPAAEIEVSDEKLKYRSYVLNRTPRVNLLIEIGGAEATLASSLKYASILASAHQWMIPPAAFAELWDAGFRVEAFASPFNANVLGHCNPMEVHVTGGKRKKKQRSAEKKRVAKRKTQREEKSKNCKNCKKSAAERTTSERTTSTLQCAFFSLFGDVDKPFGSQGDFFARPVEEMLEETPVGGWVVNPPFVVTIMRRAAKRAAEIARERDVIFVTRRYDPKRVSVRAEREGANPYGSFAEVAVVDRVLKEGEHAYAREGPKGISHSQGRFDTHVLYAGPRSKKEANDLLDKLIAAWPTEGGGSTP